MGDLQDVTRTPKTVVINGKEYRASPLTLGDFAEFEDWKAANGYRQLRHRIALLGDAMPDEQKQAMLDRAATDFEKGKPVGGPDSPNELAYFLFLRLRKNHPGLTYEVLLSDLTAEKLDSAMEALREEKAEPKN